MRLISILTFTFLALLLSASHASAVFTFSRTQSLIVSADTIPGPQAMALVDVNKDNRADILVVDRFDDQVWVFLNDGNGGFPSTPTSIAYTGSGPVAVATGDFNNDGQPDLVTVNGDADTVTVYLGLGDGFFSQPRNFEVDSSPVGVAVGDFDNDGITDLAVLSDSTIHLLKGNNDGTFTDFPTASIPTERGSITTSSAVMILSGLINTDLFPDLVVANHDSGTVSVLLGKDNGTFQAPVVTRVSDLPNAIAIADLNGDAYKDVAVVLERTGADSADNVQLLFGDKDGTFPSSAVTTAQDTDTAIAAADFDGDGQTDMVVANEGQGLGVTLLCNKNGICFDSGPYANPPEGGFQMQFPILVGPAAAVQSGNINADALPDLILLSADGSSIDVVINTTGQVPTRTPIPPTPTPTPTPRIVYIGIGSANGGPGDTVTVAVSLRSSGLSVAATGNDISFDPGILSLDPSDCRVNPAIGKELVASVVLDDWWIKTMRFFVRSGQNTDPVPDGLLYTCTFSIAPSALPGTYRLSVDYAAAFSPQGTQLPNTVGSGGFVVVSLVPLVCVGDCNGAYTVTVDEILTMVNIALGNTPVTTCEAGDANRDGHITVDEILTAMNNALNGCVPPRMTPVTGTLPPTPTPVGTRTPACMSTGGGCILNSDCCSQYCSSFGTCQ